MHDTRFQRSSCSPLAIPGVKTPGFYGMRLWRSMPQAPADEWYFKRLLRLDEKRLSHGEIALTLVE